LQWLRDDGKAYQIVFRDEGDNLVTDKLQSLCKLTVTLKKQFASIALGGEQKKPMNTRFYQVGLPEDIVTFAKNGAPRMDASNNRVFAPVMLSASQSQASADQQVTADLVSFGLFNIAGFMAPSTSLDDLSCYPNPFDPTRQSITLQYYLKQNSDVGVAIYDLLGGLVKTWKITAGDTNASAGLNMLAWDGKNGQGDVVANGGYIVFVHADGQNKKFKVLVIK
jgi:hypothetical protein